MVVSRFNILNLEGKRHAGGRQASPKNLKTMQIVDLQRYAIYPLNCIRIDRDI